MADISTGRQRGIVPFVDETTGRLPDQYLPQGVIDLKGDLNSFKAAVSETYTTKDEFNNTKTEVEQILSKYVPLSTYQALEARVQALEAKLANK